jgi:hypothetical protein
MRSEGFLLYPSSHEGFVRSSHTGTLEVGVYKGSHKNGAFAEKESALWKKNKSENRMDVISVSISVSDE